MQNTLGALQQQTTTKLQQNYNSNQVFDLVCCKILEVHGGTKHGGGHLRRCAEVPPPVLCSTVHLKYFAANHIKYLIAVVVCCSLLL